MHLTVTYRPPIENMAPSALSIDGEPVWAEILRDYAQSILYITRSDHGMSHIWIAWVNDDGSKEFFALEPISDDGENPMDFGSHASALRTAAEMAGCRR
jgi:hypothetical protein